MSAILPNTVVTMWQERGCECGCGCGGGGSGSGGGGGHDQGRGRRQWRGPRPGAGAAAAVGAAAAAGVAARGCGEPDRVAVAVGWQRTGLTKCQTANGACTGGPYAPETNTLKGGEAICIRNKHPEGGRGPYAYDPNTLKLQEYTHPIGPSAFLMWSCLRDVVMPDHEGCDHITKAVVSTSRPLCLDG